VARIDYDEMAPDYDLGRALPPGALNDLRAALTDYLSAESAGPVLDLGCGTGHFALLLAEWFGVEVIGVEPSQGMRAEAKAKATHRLVRYVGGRAEEIPLRTDGCGVAWLAHMVHHVDDLQLCMREVRRVVVPGGRLLIRGAFPGRFNDITMFEFWPSAATAVQDFPTREFTIEACVAAGFAVEKLLSLPQVTAPSLRDYLEKAKSRADTSLTLISDAEFERGLHALERAAAEETEPRPVIDQIDLLVLS
jgi:ubiquinone/menaquinone biosynthesis C-methylase UbiE